MLIVTIAGCVAPEPPCPPVSRDPRRDVWQGTLVGSTVSDGDVVALSCTTLTRMEAGTDTAIDLPPQSVPFAIASSGGSDLYVGNAIIDSDAPRLSLASVAGTGDVLWNVDLGRGAKGAPGHTLLAGPDGPVLVGANNPNGIARYRAADGALIDQWIETSTTPPVVGVDAAGNVLVATTADGVATLRGPTWTRTFTGTGAALVAVQPIAHGRTAVIGRGGGDQFVAVLGAGGATEWSFTWPKTEQTLTRVAEIDGHIAIGDVLTHFVYGPDHTFQQWDVIMVDDTGPYTGSSHNDAERQRWLGLAATPDIKLWATVSSTGTADDGTEDPDPTLLPTQEVFQEDLPLENVFR